MDYYKYRSMHGCSACLNAGTNRKSTSGTPSLSKEQNKLRKKNGSWGFCVELEKPLDSDDGKSCSEFRSDRPEYSKPNYANESNINFFDKFLSKIENSDNDFVQIIGLIVLIPIVVIQIPFVATKALVTRWPWVIALLLLALILWFFFK